MTRGVIWRSMFLLATVGAVVAILLLKPQNDASTAAAGGTPTRVDQAALARSAPRGTLLELGSDKCVPCRMMRPILDDLRTAHAGTLQVEFIDVWKDPEAGRKYAVEMIPTQIALDASGREVMRHTGFYPREELVAKLRELKLID